jgi:hypothetical protein
MVMYKLSCSLQEQNRASIDVCSAQAGCRRGHGLTFKGAGMTGASGFELEGVVPSLMRRKLNSPTPKSLSDSNCICDRRVSTLTATPPTDSYLLIS